MNKPTYNATYNGTSPIISPSAYIHNSSILIGDIEVAEHSSIWPLVAARGDVNVIRIGKNTNVQDGTVLHVSRPTKGNPEGYPLIIGDDVTVGHKCMLHGCVVGNRVLIGMGAVVMDGVEVEDDVFIGAGSLVPPNKTLQSGYLYVGNPVSKKRELTQAELAFLKTSATNYVRLKDEYIEQGL